MAVCGLRLTAPAAKLVLAAVIVVAASLAFTKPKLTDTATAAATLSDLGGGTACACSLLTGTPKLDPALIQQVRRNFAAGRRLVVLINYTGRVWHFGQQGASYAQERMLASLFGCDVAVHDFWHPGSNDTEFAAALAQAALVVANSEGTLHDRRTRLHDTLAVVAAQADAPLWLINASFEFDLGDPSHANEPALFTRAAYSAVREGMSHSALRTALPWWPIVLSADLTMLLPSNFSDEAAAAELAARRPGGGPAAAAAAGERRPLRVVLSASSASDRANYNSFWRQLVPLVLRQHPGSTFILAIEKSPKTWDELAAANRGGRFERLQEYETLAEVLWVMAGADVFIGGRFHAATFAFLAGLPAVLLPGNTWKLEAWAAIAASRGVAYVAQGVPAGAEEIWARAGAAMRHRRGLARRNRTSLKQLALRNFPLVEPVPVAQAVTAEELRMQRAWMAFIASGRKRATLCERLGCSCAGADDGG